MADINLEAPDFKPENENPRQRGRPRIQPVAVEKSLKPVKVCCITEAKPWVEVAGGDGTVEARPMDIGETAEIPEWIADILVRNKHAVRV